MNKGDKDFIDDLAKGLERLPPHPEDPDAVTREGYLITALCTKALQQTIAQRVPPMLLPQAAVEAAIKACIFASTHAPDWWRSLTEGYNARITQAPPEGFATWDAVGLIFVAQVQAAADELKALAERGGGD